ncbi:TVP38/TMEM64 family protein [Zhenhengia yiwuensis]|uniref:TVP38/TMEM64 family protein n=1 Tax=Zhenhengia yiwuensis TaxID=2763666 RepID=UPI001B5C9942|nr:TVP38/TMEM64 family protein [Zhenhengia yiwuensis]MBP3912469.1 TVP38/TMEM64 family protein [Niameybacter sp.]
MGINQTFIKKLINLSSIIGILATIALLIYGYQAGIFSSAEQLSYMISQAGIWGPLIFIFIQIIQCVIPIIPGGLSCVAGIILFGPFYGFIYNYIGILLGSLINFILARHYGKPLIETIVSKKTYNKYISWLDRGKHFDKLFALAIFMPVAPDDFLCMLAGLTKMTYKKFITIIVLGKPASLLVYSLGLTTALEAIMKTLG